VSLESGRRNYARDALLESGVASDPIVQLQRWLDDASTADAVGEPNAMCLSTVGSDGRPSARIVLLRGLDARGLTFYTSYFSRKGRDLTANPHVAATFHWPQLERQVRVEGDVAQLDDDESDAYFETRPRGHRLSAWASEQSESIDNRELLDERMAHFDARFEGEDVPRPHSWGGYRIAPVRFEFWQGRPNRMHDRIAFERSGMSWSVSRLQP
jgi:pyridoxamine 5'-phosphate oxidase